MDQDTCTIKYEKFIKEGDVTILGQCYKTNIQNYTITDKQNPILSGETCKLVTTKKQTFYKHRYDPTNIISGINTNFKDNPY